MAHFFCKLIAPRPTFAFDMSEDEKTLMQQHAAYWMGLLNHGTVLVFGPVMDPKGPFGMGVIEAADAAEAERLSAGDPVTQANCGFRYEISPMRAITRATTT